MANQLTQMINIIEPTSFANYSMEKAVTKNLLLTSGAMVRTALLDEKANDSGRVVHLPFISNFDHVESDLANDTNAVPDASKYDGLETRAQIDRRTKSWSASVLASAVAGTDFIEAAATNVGNYLADDLNARVMAKIKGYLAENATSPGGGDLHTQNDAIYKIGNCPPSAPMAQI